MFSSDDEHQGLVLGVIFGVIALVVSLVVGVSVYTRNQAQPPLIAANAVSESAIASVNGIADGASFQVEKDVLKFYFASGKADLAAGAGAALADVVKALASGQQLVISGFHDASGDATLNAQLAKQRAVAVRDALTVLGVPEARIALKKPEAMAASGSAAEARRVEVRVQ